MALDFGKLDYSVSLNRTSAFPLDAKSYFESKTAADAAAATADYAGSKNTSYYFGQTVAVVENGITEFYIIGTDKTLKKLIEGANIFYVGYYHNSKFYEDSTYTKVLVENSEILYFDLNSDRFYRYNSQSEKYIKQDVQDIPEATSDAAGIMKLHQEQGEDVKGTISQAVITDSIDKIKFTTVDGDAECLILNKPW